MPSPRTPTYHGGEWEPGVHLNFDVLLGRELPDFDDYTRFDSAAFRLSLDTVQRLASDEWEAEP